MEDPSDVILVPTFAGYMKGMFEEADSSLNTYYTGIAVGHDPTAMERRHHYFHGPGAQNYQKVHRFDPFLSLHK